MKRSTKILTGVCLLAAIGACLFWPHDRLKTAAPADGAVASNSAATKNAASPVAGHSATASSSKLPTLNTNKLAFRLSNTTNSIHQLEANPHAILLANAFIDTDKPLDLKIPAHLKSSGDPGAYIVQAKGATDARFRAMLLSAGGQIVSYIPNNAYLVNITAGGAGALAGNRLVQAVLPYEPYYKIQSSLLGLAVNNEALPPGTALNLGIFGKDEALAEQAIEDAGAKIIGHDRSAFGPEIRVLAPPDWTQLIANKVVQFAEVAHSHTLANDLSRVTLGISPDTTSAMTNDYWPNPPTGAPLNGNHVLVALNDSGIDKAHPDFTATGTAAAGPSGATRIFAIPGDLIDLVDTNGHGTFNAGIIAGNGSESLGLTGPLGPGPNVGGNAEGSITNADFRGKAPLANLFSLGFNNSDYVLQTNAAMIGALISNNSWDNGDQDYDLAAASYDAATRDAMPFSTGSQPVLFVFAAGNDGGGDDSGNQGAADTINSPGTAKNVITVGALEQFRNITNIVTTITPGTGTNAPTTNQIAYWQPQTDSANEVAYYSSRGNVGIGTEGSYGRFKPDVVAPGTFVVSTRSSQMDTNSYYNPTNDIVSVYTGQIVATNQLSYYNVSVPPTAVAVIINIFPNTLSPNPFPQLLIYAKQSTFPTTNVFDILVHSNTLAIPPQTGGVITGIQSIQGNGFSFAVGNTNNFIINYDLTIQVLVTNNVGDLYQVLEGMNEKIAPYYRYESGTSMAAAGVSGVLALIQDYFTNDLSLMPSPALMKALLINGTRSEGSYKLSVTNTINEQGWGLENIQNCIPPGGLTSQFNTPGSSFFIDQSPTNALATGESHTIIVTLDPTSFSQYLPFQATLVWTDPPGDPSAALKLVNNLDLIITNLDTGEVYFGNDISPEVGYNQPWDTNSPPNLDSINNVENILLQPLLAGKYSVTVVGRSVNVNAVTAQVNNPQGQYAPNVVQDYALVISVGDVNYGQLPAGFMVSGETFASNPTGDQNLTVVVSTNAPLVNQIAGENSPLMGTNNLPIGTNTVWGPQGVVTIGMTNQWHFYLVTNTGPASDFTNAAFITYGASTLSIPRMGTLDPLGLPDATRPEGDIDLYVSQDPALTNLSPVVISNCLMGTSTVGFGVRNGGVSLLQGGTEFVFFTNSAPGQIYYVGVKSEDRQAVEYSFLPVFTDIPFSGLDQNGNQIVNGLLLPVYVPDGNNAHPGVTNIFALAIVPMEVEKVTVTNLNEHQNFGDLFGQLTFSGEHVVLNNHDGFGNTFGHLPIVYDDTVKEDRPLGTTNADGPGSLLNFQGKSALGPWILGELDNSLTQTGRVSRFTLLIQPHRDLKQPGIIVAVPPGGWFIDYVDVLPGFTNLTFDATNVTLPTPGTPPIQMYEKLGNDPTLTDYDQRADLTNGTPPGNFISVGPPLPPGRYFIGLYNPNTTISQNVFLSATLGINKSANDIFDYSSGSPTPLQDDAVSASTITIPNTVTDLISSVSVGIVVNSSRISDYTFTLVSPTGQRVLLMENRGAGDTNGAGEQFIYTNVLNSTATGGSAANTNYLAVDPLGGTVPITWNFYSVPDQMTVYDTTNALLFSLTGPDLRYNSGLTNNPLSGPGAQDTVPVTVNVSYPPGVSNITIIMNQFGNPDATGGDAWTYTAGAAVTNFEYLMFTDNTNLTDVPIKFAAPPFNFTEQATNFTLSDFDLSTNGDYLAPTNVHDAFGGWTVPTNLVLVTTIVTNGQFAQATNIVALSNNFVSVVSDPSVALTGDTSGSNYLALAYGTITRSIPTIPGHQYNVTFWYRGPDIAGWWRGEGNATDSSDPENDNNNGRLIGRFNFPAGEVGQAFEFDEPGNAYQFAGTNAYVQVPASTSLNVGAGAGFTLEGWICPTNLAQPQPLFEWISRAPTNTAITNISIVQGPVLDPATGNYYYLLAATNRTTSELWAQELGGHLATVTTANLENWIYDTFTAYGTLNRDLWIGLAYTNSTGTFAWSSGLTNLPYKNWAPTQPSGICAPDQYYVAIMGPTNTYPGLWQLEDDRGLTCDAPPTNRIYGVVEVTNLPPIGVQFWVSATNSYDPTVPVNTNAGSLFGIIAGSFVTGGITNYGEIFVSSLPGLLQTDVYQHVALTFNTNSGIAQLFLNGTNVATTVSFTNITSGGIGPIPTNSIAPNTSGDMFLGRDMSRYTNNYFAGEMDEMSVYARALSHAEISGIYRVSAETTNRLVGKFDPTITPAVGLSEALVTFGASSNIIYGVNNQWELNSFTFTATSNSMPLTISGLEPGILLDDFGVQEAPETNLYYLPEQTLEALAGTSAAGTWTLQVWDNRVGGGLVTNFDQLLSWQLSLVLDSNAVISATLSPETPVTTTPPGGQTVYYAVPVPAWAHQATNILVSSDQPVNLLYFQPNNPPGSGNLPDATLLANSTGGVGSPILDIASAPPFQLQRGSTYYLGVQNLGGRTATVKLEVDFDIVGLTNGVPFSDVLTNEYQSARYFTYLVNSNAYEATFQLLKLQGNADLVVSRSPLPDLNHSSYASFNTASADENIYVLTNSAPVPLTNGLWYLGVINRDGNTAVHYSVLAKELDNYVQPGNPVVITLTNEVPFTWTAGPGAALTNFFRFHATNSVVNGTNVVLQGLRFEVYNLTGNGDLTVQTNGLPLAPPFFQTSQNPRNNPELIYVATNTTFTNLAGDWYLGVPNRETNMISYTIVVGIQTNLYFPAFPGAVGAGGGAIGAGHAGSTSSVYHVTTLADSGPGSLRAAVSAPNRTVVFDIGGIIGLASPLIITNSNITLAGQTAPGGITVAGAMTSVAETHDVIVRDIRFRPAADTTSQVQNVVWSNGFEGASDEALGVTGYVAGWQIITGDVDWLNRALTADPYEGDWFIDLDGYNPADISTNVLTVAGNVYELTFAYARNPGSITRSPPFIPQAAVLINHNQIGAVAANYINSWDNLNWQLVSFVFTATSSSSLLEFKSLDAPDKADGVLLDAVSLSLLPGPTSPSNGSFQFLTASNVIADHISAEWTSDSLVSVLNSSNVTVQWSLLADSLYLTNNTTSSNGPTAIGSLIRQGSGLLSFNHNLYADNYSGNPRLGDSITMDFVNNVIYNWGIRSGVSDGTNALLDFSPNGLTNQLNYVANYLIAGPDTALFATNNFNITNIAFFFGGTNSFAENLVYQTNNFIDSDTNGILNGANTGWGMFTNAYTRSGRPFPTPPVPVDEAYQAYERVLDFAGTALSQRDLVDTNIVTKVRYQTGRFISSVPLIVSGAAAWYKGENNGNDSAGLNNGTVQNGLGYGVGEVGNAFNFGGTGQYLLVNPVNTALDVGQGGGFTIECWVKPASLTAQTLPIVEYEAVLGQPASGVGVQFYANLPNTSDNLYANIVDTLGQSHILALPAGYYALTQAGVWAHVALTYDQLSGVASMYTNGVIAAQASLGSFTPQTSYTNILIGSGTSVTPNDSFYGGMDEVTFYNVALSSSQIAAIYNAGSQGKAATVPASTQTYLDTDQDGLPDFWEDTFTTNNLYVPSQNNDRDGDGYTDLEEYNNWLAAPHALTTVTNPVGVDLYQLCGGSGHLAFFLTNSIHGYVYLTNVLGLFTNTSPVWSNNIAVFTPTNGPAGTNYFGYASFSFYVTNLDTAAYFGPVAVSVIVSPVDIMTNPPADITTLSSGVMLDPTNNGGSQFYHIVVGPTDYGAIFEIQSNTGPMAMVIKYGLPLPSLSSFDYYTNKDTTDGNLVIAVLTNSTPVPLQPGDWYMGAVNENNGKPVIYNALITLLSSVQPPQFLNPPNGFVTNILETVPWSMSLVATDLDTPPLPLSYAVVSQPAGGGLFISNNSVIYWTPTEAQGPSTNNLVKVSVSNGAFTVTNTFTIVVEESNLPPVLPVIPVQFVSTPDTLVVNDTATDPDLPTNTLGYTITSTVPGINQPVINTNGIITWTPTASEAFQLFQFTVTVTDTNPWAVNSQSLSDTKSFYVLTVPNIIIGRPGTNIIAANSTNWFAVRVPKNAIFATNDLIFATGLLNLWYSTNILPTTDYELLKNVTSGISVLSTNLATAPTNLVPGGIYFLGLANTNNFAVTNALRVDFALASSTLLSLPTIPDQYIAAGDTLVVTNTATDTNANAVLSYSLIDPQPGAVISTNGVITWVTTTNTPPTNVLFTTIVTDIGANVSVENTFHVIVLPGTGPITNILAPGGISWFFVHVPSNADMATNILLFATGPLNMWYSTNQPPSITNAADFELLTNSVGGFHVITTNPTPVLVPGGHYFLAVQNPNSYAVTNAVDWHFHLVPSLNFSIFSITQTNLAGTNGFLITWFAPSGSQFHLQWTRDLVPALWTNFNGVISFTSFIAATNSEFQYFDDGSQTGGFGPTRFYRLLLLNSPTNTAPFFLNTPVQFYAQPSVPFTYTNSAKDWDVPPQLLVYSVTNTLAATNVTINPLTGVISWTPDPLLLGQTNFITTTVTDNGVPNKNATNIFAIVVSTNSMVAPAINSIAIVPTGVQFNWTAPSSQQFKVQWATNLMPPVVWHQFPNIISSGTGVFSFTDTNTPLTLMKFYELMLYP